MNIAIILSGGIGSRMGLDSPKQYVEVEGKPVIGYCLETILEMETIDVVVIGCASEWRGYVKEIVAEIQSSKTVLYALSGETRQYSIFNALKVARTLAQGEDDIVIIHDAARPLVSRELITRCIDGCRGADGVMPVLAVKDTTYQSEDGIHIKALLDRKQLWAGQAPEAFNLAKYLRAHETMSREELIRINGSTELAFKFGLECVMVEGDPLNFKITTPEDLSNFKSIISNR
ncbi:IspD/TarI family cytidylyltransferase [uncultured Bacteroides sp.]|uniref:IspD/TarI family cytidylyltransferase n=1 Tax=uncultured Bacteroides sp. TaxID=162156 RepID=UPI0026276CBA|nr:IspD/TarI family cytidylyltransferase [uncultured Bacteroides sp.]